MTVTSQQRGGYLERPAPSGLADVIDTILDKGLVIDAYVRVSLVGIELITIDARIVVASVDTYLRFAEATSRLDLHEKGGKDIMSLMSGGAHEGAKGKTSGAIEGVKNALTGDDDEDSDEQQPRRTTSKSSSSSRRRRSES